MESSDLGGEDGSVFRTRFYGAQLHTHLRDPACLLPFRVLGDPLSQSPLQLFHCLVI